MVVTSRSPALTTINGQPQQQNVSQQVYKLVSVTPDNRGHQWVMKPVANVMVSPIFFFNNLKHFTNTCSVKYLLLYMQGTNFCGFHDSTNTYIKNQLKFNVYFPLVVLQG